jgi:ABC-2 type transport system permease protein
MNTPSNAIESFDSQVVAPAAMSATRPMYWSVRRELWENRSIYVAPLAAAAVFLLGFLVSLIWLPGNMRATSALEPARHFPMEAAGRRSMRAAIDDLRRAATLSS